MSPKLIGFTIATFIVLPLFYWYNCVWWSTNIPLTALYLLGCLGLLVVNVNKTIGPFFGVLFFVTLAVQILSWFKVVHLPIF